MANELGSDNGKQAPTIRFHCNRLGRDTRLGRAGGYLLCQHQTRDIEKITSAGVVSVFTSLPTTSVYAGGLAFDVSGNLYVTDPNKDQINEITPSGTVSLFKALPTNSFPVGLAFDGSAISKR